MPEKREPRKKKYRHGEGCPCPHCVVYYGRPSPAPEGREPEVCPECGHAVITTTDGEDWYCPHCDRTSAAPPAGGEGETCNDCGQHYGDIIYDMPDELWDRPKMGFCTPLPGWLLGPLREWAEDLLTEDRLKREGFLDVKKIHNVWKNLLAGNSNAQYQIWNVLMFQSWLEMWM